MASRFELTSCWAFDTGRERVFAAIADAERWRRWWPGLVEATRLAAGDDRGIGEIGRFVWRAPIGYRVGFEATTTRRKPPSLLEADVRGDLNGVGRWVFDGDDEWTEVRYSWDVVVTGRLRSPASRMLRPVLVREHDRLMAAGAHGLAAHLGCSLLSES